MKERIKRKKGEIWKLEQTKLWTQRKKEEGNKK